MSSFSSAPEGRPEEALRKQVKALIRKRLRGVRNTLPASACQARSARIVNDLAKLDAVRDGHTVALFWPIENRHEVDLRELDAILRKRGARVAYPTILDSGEMIFAFVDDVASMQMHPLGFLAPVFPPPAKDVVAALDVIVVPAIAIDPRGYRIGYGAGYYDRALAAHPESTTIGVAFDFQLIPEVATTSGDMPVSFIVTDRRVLRASPELSTEPAREPSPT
jgi:5-formyltetrahydrofolate cyclo-ligase